jgi:glutathione peroxidase-family protein
MPSAFLVDRDGRIVTHHVGFTRDSPRVEEAEIQKLLAQKSPTS